MRRTQITSLPGASLRTICQLVAFGLPRTCSAPIPAHAAAVRPSADANESVVHIRIGRTELKKEPPDDGSGTKTHKLSPTTLLSR
jgi:hypothetical protein